MRSSPRPTPGSGSRTITLPEDGPVYLVAWHPGGQTGKLWLATGTIELSDVAVSEFIEWSEAVHAHETGRYDRVEPVTEEVCLDGAPADREAPTDASGCATALSGGLALALAGSGRAAGSSPPELERHRPAGARAREGHPQLRVGRSEGVEDALGRLESIAPLRMAASTSSAAGTRASASVPFAAASRRTRSTATVK